MADPHNGLSKMTAGLLRVQAFRRQPPALFYAVAEAEPGMLTGFLSYWLIDGTTEGQTTRVLAMFVAPHTRRQRTGERLVRSLARAALERGCTRIRWSVADASPDAKAFSMHLGASVVDDGTDYQLTGPVLRLLGTGAEPITADSLVLRAAS